MRTQVKLVKLKTNSKEESECSAYKEAKANNAAFIIEDGWIVRVFADNHREKIKYVGNTSVSIKDFIDKKI